MRRDLTPHYLSSTAFALRVRYFSLLKFRAKLNNIIIIFQIKSIFEKKCFGKVGVIRKVAKK